MTASATAFCCGALGSNVPNNTLRFARLAHPGGVGVAVGHVGARPGAVGREGIDAHQAAMNERVDRQLTIAAEMPLNGDGEPDPADALHVFSPVAGGGGFPALATNRLKMLDAVLLMHGSPARLPARLLLRWLLHRRLPIGESTAFPSPRRPARYAPLCRRRLPSARSLTGGGATVRHRVGRAITKRRALEKQMQRPLGSGGWLVDEDARDWDVGGARGSAEYIAAEAYHSGVTLLEPALELAGEVVVAV